MCCRHGRSQITQIHFTVFVCTLSLGLLKSVLAEVWFWLKHPIMFPQEVKAETNKHQNDFMYTKKLQLWNLISWFPHIMKMKHAFKQTCVRFCKYETFSQLFFFFFFYLRWKLLFFKSNGLKGKWKLNVYIKISFKLHSFIAFSWW